MKWLYTSFLRYLSLHLLEFSLLDPHSFASLPPSLLSTLLTSLDVSIPTEWGRYLLASYYVRLKGLKGPTNIRDLGDVPEVFKGLRRAPALTECLGRRQLKDVPKELKSKVDLIRSRRWTTDGVIVPGGVDGDASPDQAFRFGVRIPIPRDLTSSDPTLDRTPQTTVESDQDLPGTLCQTRSGVTYCVSQILDIGVTRLQIRASRLSPTSDHLSLTLRRLGRRSVALGTEGASKPLSSESAVLLAAEGSYGVEGAEDPVAVAVDVCLPVPPEGCCC
ncbi:hypothetical protein HDU67_010209, partial [Dinochytrium kinnereticum]